MGKIDFSAESPLGQEMEKWRNSLQGHKGDRAAFCRAKGVSDIILLPEFHHALQRFKRFFSSEKFWEDRLAAVLGLLSHVRQTADEKKLAEQMAGNRKGAVVSELRFRRLIQLERREDLYQPMIRILRMLKSRANSYDLANSVYYWGPKTKNKWAYKYFSQINK